MFHTDPLCTVVKISNLNQTLNVTKISAHGRLSCFAGPRLVKILKVTQFCVSQVRGGIRGGQKSQIYNVTKTTFGGILSCFLFLLTWDTQSVTGRSSLRHRLSQWRI